MTKEIVHEGKKYESKVINGEMCFVPIKEETEQEKLWKEVFSVAKSDNSCTVRNYTFNGKQVIWFEYVYYLLHLNDCMVYSSDPKDDNLVDLLKAVQSLGWEVKKVKK